MRHPWELEAELGVLLLPTVVNQYPCLQRRETLGAAVELRVQERWVQVPVEQGFPVELAQESFSDLNYRSLAGPIVFGIV